MKINLHKLVLLMPIMAFLLFTSCQEDIIENPNENEEIVGLDKQVLDTNLKSCAWMVNVLTVNNDPVFTDNDSSTHYFTFKDDGVLEFNTVNGDPEEGTWDSEESDGGFIITIDIGMTWYDGKWLVSELGDNKLELNKDGGSKIIIEKNCDPIDKQALDTKLKSCAWMVNVLTVDNDPVFTDNDSSTHYFTFKDDGVLEFNTVNGDSMNGTWDSEESNGAFIITIDIGMTWYDGKWLVSELGDNKLELNKDGGSKIITEKNCDPIENEEDETDNETLLAYLKSCPWSIESFYRGGEMPFHPGGFYFDLKFENNNVLKYSLTNGIVKTGEWTTSESEDGLIIKLDMNFDWYDGEWLITNLGEGEIKLSQGEESYNILKKDCDLDLDIDLERVENILQECPWRIASLNVFGFMDVGNTEIAAPYNYNEKPYVGTHITFYPDKSVKLKINGGYEVGTYSLEYKNSAYYILQIFLEGRPNLELQWTLQFLSLDSTKFTNQDSSLNMTFVNELVLESYCSGGTSVNDVLPGGEWYVSSYIEGNEDKTGYVDALYLTFETLGNFYFVVEGSNYTGSWLTDSFGGSYLGLNFGDNTNPRDLLTDRWSVDSFSENKIILKDYSYYPSGRTLILER